MVERQNLTVANTLDKCKGVITRERKAGDKVEKSVIDYLIVCDGMKEYLEEMFIDDDRIFVLTKYTKNGNKKTSDHNVIMGKFRLKFNRNRAKPRTEFFNFKDRVNQDLFYEETNNSSKLSSSFSSGRSFPHNANIFMKNLKSTFHKCFDKVRISSGVKDQYGESQMQELPRLKMELRRFLLNNVCLIGKKIAEEKLKETEHLLSNNFAFGK